MDLLKCLCQGMGEKMKCSHKTAEVGGPWQSRCFKIYQEHEKQLVPSICTFLASAENTETMCQVFRQTSPLKRYPTVSRQQFCRAILKEAFGLMLVSFTSHSLHPSGNMSGRWQSYCWCSESTFTFLVAPLVSTHALIGQFHFHLAAGKGCLFGNILDKVIRVMKRRRFESLNYCLLPSPTFFLWGVSYFAV